MMIAGFILAHLGLLLILLGFIMPRYYDVFIPLDRRNEEFKVTQANQPPEETPEETITNHVNKETAAV